MKTISFEIANKLYKLGVRERSYMVYLSGVHAEPELLPTVMQPGLPDTEVVNAYTLDEILEILPPLIRTPNYKEWEELTPHFQISLEQYRPLGIFKDPVAGTVKACYGADRIDRVIEKSNKNAADAAAELLIAAIEHDFLKLEDL
jgi:hypothetical protein